MPVASLERLVALFLFSLQELGLLVESFGFGMVGRVLQDALEVLESLLVIVLIVQTHATNEERVRVSLISHHDVT